MDTGTMEDEDVGNELTMESRMMKRFGSLQDVLSLCQLPEEYKEIFLGRKRDLKSAYCTNVGPDNAVDMIFAHKRCNGNDHIARIPMEGGSTTSIGQDYACLGRDPELWNLKPQSPVTSLADGDTAEQEEIENPHEANNSVPNRPASGKYRMKHDVFPMRQIVSYMLSMKTRYGILSTGYRFDFLKLEVTRNRKLVVHIAGPFWSVKQLNTSVTADREDEGKRIATEYYANIHKYPDAQVSICNPDVWTTNIGEYPFLVGLFRFFFAASGLVGRHDFHGNQGRNDGDHEDGHSWGG